MKRSINLAVVTVILVIAGLFHGPVFGDASGYIAVFGGILVGIGVAALAWSTQLGILMTSVLTALAYLVFGGAFALPETTIGRVIPTGETFRLLLTQSVRSWKDLLTLEPPANAFEGPTVLPFMLGLLCAVLAASAALRLRHAELALIPVVVLAVTGTIWGMNSQSWLWPSVLGTVVAVLWAARLSNSRRYTRLHEPQDPVYEVDAARKRRNFALGAVAMLVVGGLIGGFGAPKIQAAQTRWVARDHIIPELDLTEFPAPLAEYRSYVDLDKEKTLFTVEGLKEGQRIRLATMDVYNGIVYDIAPYRGDGGFVHTGHQVKAEPETDATTTTLKVTIKDYRGVWLPGAGDLTQIEFDGENASDLSRTFFVNRNLEAALVKTGLTTDDVITATSIDRVEPNDKLLAGRSFGALAMPSNEKVPEQIQSLASEYIGQETSPILQARLLEQSLKSKGFYASADNGEMGRPGHRAQRIADMVDNVAMVGDDEQYSVLMALMARSAGMPARVVMGFYPETYQEGAIDIKGEDAHAWVEIYFADAGWITFDPTPPRDQQLKTELPQAAQNPRPRVLQPPEPPETPAELTADDREKQDNDEDESNAGGIPTWVFYVGGGSLLLLLPFLLIILHKVFRTAARRRKGTTDRRIAASWNDVLDTARDYQYAVDPLATRTEQANSLSAAAQSPTELKRAALSVDRVVFGLGDPDEKAVEAAWVAATEAKDALKKSSKVGGLRARISLASLRKGREKHVTGVPKPTKTRKRLHSRKQSVEGGAPTETQPGTDAQAPEATEATPSAKVRRSKKKISSGIETHGAPTPPENGEGA